MSKAYEITAVAKAGRDGLVQTTDGSLSMMMASPKAIGLKTEHNNPEQLFASGYASCFSQAMFAVAKKNNVELKEAPIKVHVELDVDPTTGYNLYVGIEADLAIKDAALATKIMKETHLMCPYSKLIKPDHFLYFKVNGTQIKI